MLIREMTSRECREALEHANVVRLACVHEQQPYVVPMFVACHQNYIYGFTTLGQKIEWLRLNPLVCVEADEITSSDEWTTVVVLGRFEELPDTPQLASMPALAYDLLLKRHHNWWQPGLVAPEHHDGSRTPLYYRIHIDKITGRRATPDGARMPAPMESATKEQGWIARILNRVASKR